MANNNKGLAPTKIIEKTWEAIPGYVLCFPVGISMSIAAATKREATIALTDQERTERLLDFRISTLSDILTAAPFMYEIDRLGAAIQSKRQAAIDALSIPPEEKELLEKETRRINNTVYLTPEELESHREPLPDFPETSTEELNAKAYEYFNQDDERGRKLFQLLIEEVIQEFWVWATPRPTISVSAFTQGK